MNILDKEDDPMICYCMKVAESVIVKSIKNGAKTIKDIQRTTSACTGNECEKMNPNHRCCSKEINEILNRENIEKPESCCICKSC